MLTGNLLKTTSVLGILTLLLCVDTLKADVISVHYNPPQEKNEQSNPLEKSKSKQHHVAKSTQEAEKKIVEYLNKTNKKTLIVVDIDYLLLQPENPMFQMGALKHHSKAVEWSLNRLSNAEQDIFI
ncbi:MAG: hypothetical protein Q8K36_07100, partial [Alphaproteobacteria bacterium]|nr:hypothetical protein [Alphaproteobacteria bacterium]